MCIFMYTYIRMCMYTRIDCKQKTREGLHCYPDLHIMMVGG